MPAVMDGLVAVTEGALDPDQYIGRVAFYGHPDEDRPLTDVLRTWGTHGLDVSDLPEVRKPVDFFMTACGSVKQRKRKEGEQFEIAADTVENVTGRCAYQITLKLWDREQRVIEHEKAMRLSFDKPTSAIEVTPLGDWTKDLAELERRIRAKYAADLADSMVTGNKIRNATRELLKKIGGQNLRRKGGGVYFVPTSWATPTGDREPTLPILNGLKGVVTDLYGADGDFYLLACASGEGEREMVRKHFTINVGTQMEELREKLVERVRAGKGRGVRAELVVNTMEEYRQIMGAFKEFESLVGFERDSMKAKIGDLEAAIGALQELAA